MKSCISTYSFERLYQDGGFTRFDAIDKTKEYGCQGVELVLNDETPDGSTPMEYAKALTAHAKEQGLEVPIYTTGANFFVKEPERSWNGSAGISTLRQNARSRCCAMTSHGAITRAIRGSKATKRSSKRWHRLCVRQQNMPGSAV